MPWVIEEQDGKFCVANQMTGRIIHCHDTREKALAQQRALYANISDGKAVGFNYLELDRESDEGKDRFDRLGDSDKLDLYYRLADLGEIEL